MRRHSLITTLTGKTSRHQRLSSCGIMIMLVLATALGGSKSAKADTLGPELICDQKVARSRIIECIEYRIFDEAGNETKLTKPIAYGRCPKGFLCTWDSAVDVKRR